MTADIAVECCIPRLEALNLLPTALRRRVPRSAPAIATRKIRRTRRRSFVCSNLRWEQKLEVQCASAQGRQFCCADPTKYFGLPHCRLMTAHMNARRTTTGPSAHLPILARRPGGAARASSSTQAPRALTSARWGGALARYLCQKGATIIAVGCTYQLLVCNPLELPCEADIYPAIP